MNTYETITLVIPIQDGYSFEDLRGELSRHSKSEIKKTTLRDWIVLCGLRTKNIYACTYTPDDLKALIQWIAVKKTAKRGTALRQYRELLRKQYEANA